MTLLFDATVRLTLPPMTLPPTNNQRAVPMSDDQQLLIFDGSENEGTTQGTPGKGSGPAEKSSGDSGVGDGDSDVDDGDSGKGLDGDSSEETSGEESRGRGRPPKPVKDRRTLSHGVHFSRQEKEEVSEKAEAAGMSLSRYLREAGLDREVQSAADQKIFSRLGWVGTKLDRMAQALDSGQSVKHDRLEKEIKELRGTLEKLMRRIGER